MGKHGRDKTKPKKKEKKAKNKPVNLEDIVTEDSPKDTKVRKAKSPRQNRGTKRRRTISYENVPIDEYTEAELRFDKRLVKKTLFIFVLIIILVFAVTLFVNRDNLTVDNFSAWFNNSVLGISDGKGFPVDINGTTVSKGNFRLINGKPCYASDTSYVELSDTAGEAVNAQLSYDNPVVRGTSNYNIVYGVGSKGYMICSSLEQKKKSDTETGVFSADINDKGYYAVVTEGKDYLSELSAYNSENKKIYSYMFAEYYITCVSINSRGTGAICTGITTENGIEKTRVYVLDFSTEKPVKEYEINNSVAYESFFLSSSKAILVSSDGVYSLDFESEEPKKTEYDSSILTTYSFNPDTKSLALVLSRSGDGRNCDVVTFNSNGEKEQKIETELRIDSISTYKGTIGMLSEGQAFILNNDGTLSEGVDAGNDAQSILLYSNSNAYILGISEIREVKLN